MELTSNAPLEEAKRVYRRAYERNPMCAATLAGERVPRHHAIFILAGIIASLSEATTAKHYDNALAIAREHDLSIQDLAKEMVAAIQGDEPPAAVAE